MLEDILARIEKLSPEFVASGTVTNPVLRAIARHCGEGLSASLETGSGRTTLLFSHLSRHHRVFALDLGGSLSAVKTSPLLNAGSVEFIEGPTQVTLRNCGFAEKPQAVLLDGPHAYPFPELEYYCVYPHLEPGALLIVDDIHIPTVHHLYGFLREDDMFRLLEVVGNTAFFRRTSAAAFDPLGDNWWHQRYNRKRFPLGFRNRIEIAAGRLFPERAKRLIHRFSGR